MRCVCSAVFPCPNLSGPWCCATALRSILVAVLFVAPLCAFAAAPRSVPVTATDVETTTVEITIRKKTETVTISCLKVSPGSITVKRGKMRFTSHAEQVKAANASLKRARSARAKKKARDSITRLKAIRSAGTVACKESGFLSMREYRGVFGEKQAQRLIEVFALGGRPGLAARYAGIGLEAAVKDLTSMKPDLVVDSFRTKLTCGPNPYNTTNPDQCFRDGNINDFYLDGVVSGLNWRSINSVNPAHMALFEFVMDQRAPGSPRVLNSCNQWMFPRYIEMVDRFVASGDYKAYASEWVQDSFIHGKWLSGVSNQAGILRTGNEDFAREFLELFTTGRDYPDGKPVYNDFDVYQSSLAMSGLAETRVRDQSNREVCVIGWFRDLHRAGPKTLFAGTPQQMVVEDAVDMAEKIFVAQREQVAFELARRLWSRFIGAKGTTIAYQRLAKEIIAADFKLWPVMNKMMKSQAFYAPESQETILKNPHTLFVSFARMSGIPVGNYGQMSERLDRIGMLLGRPPTVFGFTYQNELLASDVYQLERFNAFIGHTVHQNSDELKERFDWTPHKGLVAGVPLTGNPAVDLVNDMLRRLNMSDNLNQPQKDALVQFLNYSLGDCYSNSDPECFVMDGARKKLYRGAPDVGDTAADFYRLRLAYAMIANLPAFGTM